MAKYKLEDIFDLQMGKTPSRSNPDYWNSNDNKWISIGDLSQSGKYITDTKEYLSDAAVEESGIKIIPANTVVMSFKLSIGKAAITPEDMYSNEAIMAFHDKHVAELLPEYIYYMFKYKNWDEGTNKAVMGKTLNKATLSKMEIKVCHIEKQKKIVELLDKVTVIIDGRNQELYKLDELIKARFVEMFDEIKEVCEVGYYIQSLNAGKSLAGEEECKNKVLKTGAASFDYFDATQVKNLPLDYEPQTEHLVKAGDIIISRMNTAELTGAVAYVWDVQENAYLPDRLWKAKLNDECNPIFVWQMLIQPATKEQIRRECSGTSGSMKNISKPGMLAIKVKKVPFELQNQFADFVKRVDKSKVEVQRALDETQKLFDSMMQQYFG